MHNFEVMDLINTYESPLLRFVLHLLWPDESAGRDVVQMAFIKCHRYLQKNGPGSIENPKAWLFQVARNLSMDALRKRQRKQQIENKLLDDPVLRKDVKKSDLQERNNAEVYELMMNEVGTLPYEVREVLLMKHIQGMTLKSISEHTGLKMGTVNYRIKQGLAALAKRLGEKSVETKQ